MEKGKTMKKYGKEKLHKPTTKWREVFFVVVECVKNYKRVFGVNEKIMKNEIFTLKNCGVGKIWKFRDFRRNFEFFAGFLWDFSFPEVSLESNQNWIHLNGGVEANILNIQCVPHSNKVLTIILFIHEHSLNFLIFHKKNGFSLKRDWNKKGFWIKSYLKVSLTWKLMENSTSFAVILNVFLYDWIIESWWEFWWAFRCLITF